MKFTDRTGEIRYNKYGCKMKIINYRGNSDMDVMFEDGIISSGCSYQKFLTGNIGNNNCKTVYNTGYIGYGEFSPIQNRERYDCWKGMLNRCYSEKTHIKYPTYNGCSVSSEWHNFQVFAQWYNDNKWNDNIKFQLDKDILIKGNKIYSSETCILVDGRINSLFVKCNKARGNLPIGVTKCKKNGSYRALMGGHNIGLFKTPEEAFYAYKEAKEDYIKQVADMYNEKYQNFPKKLYNALYNYKVEITD